MLVVISPAKKLDENCDTDVISKFTVPPYLESSKKIIKSLREYSANLDICGWVLLKKSGTPQLLLL